MSSGPIKAYLVCGGLYHDMDYARLELLKLLSEDDRVRVEVGKDYRDVEAIAGSHFLVTYTCDVIPKTDEQQTLRRFLEGGGRWLALHGTNSILRFVKGQGWDAPRTAPEFMSLLGSQFLAHPPIQRYRVEVSDPQHPLVAGVEPFETDDELYLCEYHGPYHELLYARYRGEAPGFSARSWPNTLSTDGTGSGSDRHPVMYLHPVGRGEVLYCTLGHCRGKYDMRPMVAEYPTVERGSWTLPVYRELLRRSLRWAATSPN